MAVEIDRVDHLDAFVQLNEAWISHFFVLEEADRQLAEAPHKVIEDGGHIFTLSKDGRVIGTCALFKESDETFQLARMAVDEKFRGLGFGDELMAAALHKLEAIKARRVFLLSNKKLTAAINLYKKHGFQIVNEGPHPFYKRVDIQMEKLL